MQRRGPGLGLRVEGALQINSARDPALLFRNRVQFSWAPASRQTIALIALAVLRELQCHGAVVMSDRWRCRSAFSTLRESAVLVASATLNLGGGQDEAERRF
jgi:hypothetical protein